jgi:hypothetical protein
MSNQNSNNINFVFVNETGFSEQQTQRESTEGARSVRRGRPPINQGVNNTTSAPAQAPAPAPASVPAPATAPTPTPASADAHPTQTSRDPDDQLFDSIDSTDNRGLDTPVFTPYDTASQWVIIELFEVYFSRLELSSTSAVKANLYREIKDRYNSNSNTNGPRTLRSIKSKWNDILKTYRRRKDQESRTGQAPEAPWEFHEKMDEIASSMATVVPPTVFTSFMIEGNTVDNRVSGANESRRSRGSRTTDAQSLQQQYIEALQEMNEANYQRNQPQRDMLERYLTSSMNYHSSSLQYMQRFMESRESMIQNQQAQREDFLVFLRSTQSRMEDILQRLASTTRPVPPPRLFFPSASSDQNNDSVQNQSRKRRRSH